MLWTGMVFCISRQELSKVDIESQTSVVSCVLCLPWALGSLPSLALLLFELERPKRRLRHAKRFLHREIRRPSDSLKGWVACRPAFKTSLMLNPKPGTPIGVCLSIRESLAVVSLLMLVTADRQRHLQRSTTLNSYRSSWPDQIFLARSHAHPQLTIAASVTTTAYLSNDPSRTSVMLW